jgi:hypothetical protein
MDLQWWIPIQDGNAKYEIKVMSRNFIAILTILKFLRNLAKSCLDKFCQISKMLAFFVDNTDKKIFMRHKMLPYYVSLQRFSFSQCRESARHCCRSGSARKNPWLRLCFLHLIIQQKSCEARAIRSLKGILSWNKRTFWQFSCIAENLLIIGWTI